MKGNFVLVVSLIVLVGLGCQGTDISTRPNSSAAPQPTAATKESNKKEINKKVQVGGVELTIQRLEYERDAVLVAVEFVNNNKEPISFYPDQGKLVYGDRQLEANLFMSTGDLGGEVFPGVRRNGTIHFVLPKDAPRPEKFTLQLGNVLNNKTYKSSPAQIEIDINN